jgi:hypothetical protein
MYLNDQTQSRKTKSWRDVLPVHPAAELFPRLAADELRVLADDIKKNGLQSPIVLWGAGSQTEKADLVLLDGRNRLDALELLGVNLVSDKTGTFVAKVGFDPSRCQPWLTVKFAFKDIDPFEYVISANLHRRHLTPKQKRDVIKKLLVERPQKSDRQIAGLAKVDHKTVASVRSNLQATGEIPQLEKTIGKDGKSRKSKQAKSTSAPSTPPMSAGPTLPPTTKPEPKSSAAELNFLDWVEASIETRREFIDAVSVKSIIGLMAPEAIWDAMTKEQRDALIEYGIAQQDASSWPRDRLLELKRKQSGDPSDPPKELSLEEFAAPYLAQIEDVPPGQMPDIPEFLDRRALDAGRR